VASATAEQPLIDAVRRELAAGADPVRAARQQAYMKSSMPYHGLTTPELRQVMRRLLADPSLRPATAGEWEHTIRTLWDEATHREAWYAALSIARHPSAKPYRALGALPLYRHLVVTGAWWDVVDEVATHLVRDELLADPDRVAPVMRAWAADGNQWVRRTAILCQVGARDRIDLALLHDVIMPNLEGAPSAGPQGRQDFFIRKAIGWALRDVSYRRPDWVRAFVEEHRAALAGLSVREGLKRIM
jgi:3-methyladenine DNA glycosylase AlkD